ncbi:hypothetical protein KC328_g13974 [Hortaea werneckii]|nr:hypothetical protein KC328_g13974 [Hortaea werneckii]
MTCDLTAATFSSTSEEAYENVLELRVSDFLPKHFSDTLSSDETKIKIPFSELRIALDAAESTPDLSEISPALTLSSSSGSSVWSSGEESQPEEISPRRERKFTEAEERADENTNSMDPD